MSRSYKKEPVFKCAPCDGSIGKRFANRKVRRSAEVASGGAYKKVYSSYDIHDWVVRWTLDEAYQFESKLEAICGTRKTLQQVKKDWQKLHYRK